MQSKAETVTEYLQELPEDRRAVISAVRKVIKKNLDKRIKEGMQYGMIGYFIPHKIYPNGYHCDPQQPLPYAGLAAQKNAFSLYMMSLYINSELQAWFADQWKKTGKKLDMGKSCIRFKKLEDIPLDLIGEVIRRVTVEDYVTRYESNLKKSIRSKKK